MGKMGRLVLSCTCVIVKLTLIGIRGPVLLKGLKLRNGLLVLFEGASLGATVSLVLSLNLLSPKVKSLCPLPNYT